MLNLSLIPRIVLFVFIGCCQVIIYPTWIRSSLQLLTCGDVEANPGPQYPGTVDIGYSDIGYSDILDIVIYWI